MENSLFSCRRCGYKTNIRCNLVSHLKKAKTCTAILEDIPRDVLIYGIPKASSKNKTFKCNYCDATFTAQSNTSRHMKTCKNKSIEELHL